MGRAWIYLSIAAAVLLGPAAYNYWADPFQAFHARSDRIGEVWNQQRIQNAGLIRNYLARDPYYDTIVVGTSMTMNMRPSEIRHAGLTDGGVIKLSMSDSYARTKGIVAEAALRTGNVRRAIWGVHSTYLQRDVDAVNHGDSAFPEYLYDSNPFNDWKFLFNFDVLCVSAGWKERNGNVSEFKKEPYESYGVWADYEDQEEKTEEFLSETNLEKMRKIVDKGDFSDFRYEYPGEKPYAAMEEWIVRFAKEHPDCQFDFFFPPYSLVAFREKTPKRVNLTLGMRRFLLEKTEGLENVRIFDFMLVPGITEDISNYRDKYHYQMHITNRMLEMMGRGESRLTLESIGEWELNAAEKIRLFRL